MSTRPVLTGVDAVTVPVPDLDAALATPGTELVLSTRHPYVLVDLSRGHYETDPEGDVTGVG